MSESPKFSQTDADLYIPDGASPDLALERTTCLAIGAHQDDLEFMAYPAIAECYESTDQWFCGVICTDGRGSPRTGEYADLDDEQMRQLRLEEQREAARIGKFSAVIQLDFKSSSIKNLPREELIADLCNLMSATRPRKLFVHNPFDKHATHLAVFTAVLEAVRKVKSQLQLEAFLGCEVWRDLDWFPDEEKICLDASPFPELADRLCETFRSQIQGGKNYGLAVKGRWAANATFGDPHKIDQLSRVSHAVDLMPLLADPEMDLLVFTSDKIRSFSDRVAQGLSPTCNSK